MSKFLYVLAFLVSAAAFAGETPSQVAERQFADAWKRQSGGIPCKASLIVMPPEQPANVANVMLPNEDGSVTLSHDPSVAAAPSEAARGTCLVSQ